MGFTPELLQLMRVFGNYLRIKYLWHMPIMPLTNRNGITGSLLTGANRCAPMWHKEEMLL